MFAILDSEYQSCYVLPGYKDMSSEVDTKMDCSSYFHRLGERFKVIFEPQSNQTYSLKV